ncbi:MAG: hypothetical protein B6241_09795 [Spirochaetaceae bacterium 4572_59]|nr:MAG: hypothetical protein B6241_09795 [Spirochaetaceae bacterium 4572_59]
MAADGIDPKTVPMKKLFNGTEMPGIGMGTFGSPGIGMGTFGSDRFALEDIANAVVGAAEVGFRHFDCASVYDNETLIGQAFQTIMKGSIPREELWITSKVWNDMHDDVIKSCKQSLKDLQLDYLDLFLVHWPFPNYHAPGCDVDARSPDAKPYIHDVFMKTWRQQELFDFALENKIQPIGFCPIGSPTRPDLGRSLGFEW